MTYNDAQRASLATGQQLWNEGERAQQSADNMLMQMYRTEAGRQNTLFEAPIQMAMAERRDQAAFDRQMATAQVRNAQRQLSGEVKEAQKPTDYRGAINTARAIARQHGIDPNIAHAIAMIESRGNPNARNSGSSAGGLFQQIDANAAQYGVRNRFDPQESTIGAINFWKDIAKQTGDPNILNDVRALYFAHQQGPGGYRKFIQNRNAPAVQVFGEDKVRLNVPKNLQANGRYRNMTAQQFYDYWTGRVQREYDGIKAQYSRNDAPVMPSIPGADGKPLPNLDLGNAAHINK